MVWKLNPPSILHRSSMLSGKNRDLDSIPCIFSVSYRVRLFQQPIIVRGSIAIQTIHHGIYKVHPQLSSKVKIPITTDPKEICDI